MNFKYIVFWIVVWVLVFYFIGISNVAVKDFYVPIHIHPKTNHLMGGGYMEHVTEPRVNIFGYIWIFISIIYFVINRLFALGIIKRK